MSWGQNNCVSSPPQVLSTGWSRPQGLGVLMRAPVCPPWFLLTLPGGPGAAEGPDESCVQLPGRLTGPRKAQPPLLCSPLASLRLGRVSPGLAVPTPEHQPLDGPGAGSSVQGPPQVSEVVRRTSAHHVVKVVVVLGCGEHVWVEEALCPPDSSSSLSPPPLGPVPS